RAYTPTAKPTKKGKGIGVARKRTREQLINTTGHRITMMVDLLRKTDGLFDTNVSVASSFLRS
ncbi:MAG: hypothetical protein ACTHMB_11180, partial [Candidatus Binatia bacterium]